MNNEIVDADSLAARLVELKRANPDVAIVIRPDRELPVQKLVTLMDTLQRAQITKVGIATKAESKYRMRRNARFWRNVTFYRARPPRGIDCTLALGWLFENRRLRRRSHG